jgi:spermidine synthase
VPSFGEWGFVVASRRPFSPASQASNLPAGLKFLNPQTLRLLFDFPADMSRVAAPVNRLSNQELVHSYEQEWGRAPQ